VELIPALDLIGGGVVRLRQGDYDQVTNYGDPVELAVRLELEGATRLHLVDLDAAKSGAPTNHGVIAEIAATVSVPVQCGGGVRTLRDVERLIGHGVGRVIVGTIALEEPELAHAMAQAFPNQVLLGLDYRIVDDRLVPAGRGWLTDASTTVEALLERYASSPFAGVLATAIARDGTLEGPDLQSMERLLACSPMSVVASGGVGELEHLEALTKLARTSELLSGVVVGKAILEGRFTIAEGVIACSRLG
jgi:phosphoribosylformimino-5-aminoimidazole carboxamide ribotide isomerase